MSKNCECNRGLGPAGIWEYENMVGARVRIKSMPVSNFFRLAEIDKTYVVEDVYFRVSTDGKVITVVKLVGMEDLIFTWKDLEVISINEIEKNEQEG